jgi:hypothetical protein
MRFNCLIVKLAFLSFLLIVVVLESKFLNQNGLVVHEGSNILLCELVALFVFRESFWLLCLARCCRRVEEADGRL